MRKLADLFLIKMYVLEQAWRCAIANEVAIRRAALRMLSMRAKQSTRAAQAAASRRLPAEWSKCPRVSIAAGGKGERQ